MTPFRKGRRAGDRGAGGMGDPPGWRGAVGGASLEGWGPVLSVGSHAGIGAEEGVREPGPWVPPRGVGCPDATPISGSRPFPVGAPPASVPTAVPPARPPARRSQGLQEAFQHLDPQTL